MKPGAENEDGFALKHPRWRLPRLSPPKIGSGGNAKLAGVSENHFTNELTPYALPDYYFADETMFGPNGLRLYLRSDVERKLKWDNQQHTWPPVSDEPTPADLLKLLLDTD
jgi:hypothetical protein